MMTMDLIRGDKGVLKVEVRRRHRECHGVARDRSDDMGFGRKLTSFRERVATARNELDPRS
jgi:hypothetical protein